MSLDPVKNFAKVDVSTGYNAAATFIELASGHGDKLPQPSSDGAFNLVWWNSEDYPDPADDPDVEIVRCTARSGDVLTVTRGQEDTAAVGHNTSGKAYQMLLGVTKKTIEDLQSQTFPIEEPIGNINGTNPDFVFTVEPKAIVVNGATYRKNRGWTWNGGTLTATLAFPPDTGSDVWGVM